MTKESDSLKFSDEFKAGETGDVLEPKDNKTEKKGSWLSKAAKKAIASVAVYAALNGAVPTDVFEDGLKEAVAASHVATVVATNNELDTRSEVVASEQKRRAIFHIDSPVYISTNPVEKNVLRKSDVAPRIVDGRTLLVVRPVAEATGALVSWDEKTETASLVKDGTTVRIKKNSYTLEVESSSGINYIKMDVPAQIIDGRFVLPVRFIIEALGDTVIWDQETRSVYIGYTQEQVDSFKGAWRQENEPMDALKNPETIYKVFQHMAGGEFANFVNFNNVIVEKNGAIIVFSDKDSELIDPSVHAVLDGTTYTLEDLGREYLKQSGVEKILGNLNKGDVVFVKDGEFYVFNEESKKALTSKWVFPKVSLYDNQLEKHKIEDSVMRPGITLDIVFDSTLGPVLSDGYRITHQYDRNTNRFEELIEYGLVGTQEQRVAKTIRENRKSGDQYETEVVYDGFVFEKGGIDGLSETFIQYWIQGLKEFEEISPEDYKMCRDQYGLNVIKKIRKEDDRGQPAQFPYRGSMGGKLEFNESKYFNGNYPIQDIIDRIYAIALLESRGMYGNDHLVGISNTKSVLKMNDKTVETDNVGIEKQAYAVSKILGFADINQIKFDQYVKIRVQDLLAGWGFPNKNQYGRLSKGEFSRVQDMANGFDHYAGQVNGAK